MRANSPALSHAIDGRMPDVFLYGILFTGAVAAFCIERLIGARLGVASDILSIAGDATCGWSWLLVRALFRQPAARREGWPLKLVLILVAAGAVLRFDGGVTGGIPRMIGNVETLVSSTLLLLATIEPLTGINRETPPAERRFRLLFAAGYASVLAIAVLWVDGSPAESVAGRWGDTIKVGCALLALLGISLAIRHRRHNPLPIEPKSRPRIKTTGESALGQRLLHLMTNDALHAQPDLRVAEVARRVGEAEYKVTQCITGALGFRNFNHMANHFRIAEAKRRLADSDLDHLPILTIALDCGFGSIGPFNRAFKAETGVTPTHFRRERRTQ